MELIQSSELSSHPTDLNKIQARITPGHVPGEPLPSRPPLWASPRRHCSSRSPLAWGHQKPARGRGMGLLACLWALGWPSHPSSPPEGLGGLGAPKGGVPVDTFHGGPGGAAGVSPAQGAAGGEGSSWWASPQGRS